MAHAVLVFAATLNFALAIAGMLWSPSHHRALASMLGVTWLNRPPLFRWEGRLRRGFRVRAGAGLFALREIVLTVAAILAGTATVLMVTSWALLAQKDGAQPVILGWLGGDASGTDVCCSRCPLCF